MEPRRAIDAARECHRNGIDIIGMGFGDADAGFMREISSGDISGIMLSDSRELERGFGTIAQEISSKNQSAAGRREKEIPSHTWTAINETHIVQAQHYLNKAKNANPFDLGLSQLENRINAQKRQYAGYVLYNAFKRRKCK